jgi:hypothetical protein
MSRAQVLVADYPDELIEEALDVAATGLPLRHVAKVLDCSTKHLFRLTERDAVFKQSLLQARIWGYYCIADEMLTIAEDYKEVDPQFTRVIIEGKKWFLSKMHPSVFGDKLTIREESVDLKGALVEARTRVIMLNSAPSTAQAELPKE